jgi:hypothetical protein
MKILSVVSVDGVLLNCCYSVVLEAFISHEGHE